jgi:exosortase
LIPVIALVAAIFKTALAELFNNWWRSPEQSQGLLVAPLAVVVAWLWWRSVAAIPTATDLRGLVLAGTGCALDLVGEFAAGVYISQLSFVLVLAGVIETFWGAARLKALTPPILLLVAAIPLPSLMYASLSMPLQLLVSRIACSIADLTGVVVYREGNIIHLSGVSLGVWEACSGLN